MDSRHYIVDNESVRIEDGDTIVKWAEDAPFEILGIEAENSEIKTWKEIRDRRLETSINLIKALEFAKTVENIETIFVSNNGPIVGLNINTNQSQLFVVCAGKYGPYGRIDISFCGNDASGFWSEVSLKWDLFCPPNGEDTFVDSKFRPNHSQTPANRKAFDNAIKFFLSQTKPINKIEIKNDPTTVEESNNQPENESTAVEESNNRSGEEEKMFQDQEASTEEKHHRS